MNWEQLRGYLKQTAFDDRGDYYYSLYHLATLLPKHSPIVEIGCHRGDSTLCLALGAKETESHVITIDPIFQTGSITVPDEHHQSGNSYAASLSEMMKRFLTCGLITQVTVIPDYSHHVLPLWPNDLSIGLLVVDGEHTYTAIQRDCLWLEKIRMGGYAAFDDWFHEIELSVKDYVKEKPEWIFLHESTQGHRPDGFNLTYLRRMIND